MRRFPRSPVFAPPWAMLVIVCACNFFDPLNQAGLNLVIAPSDTTVYIGASFMARGLMVNSYGDQYPSEHIRYAGLDPSAVVRSEGQVTAVSYGRGRVVASRSRYADTGWVSVVPAGMLALSPLFAHSVDIVNVDGTGRTTVAATSGFGSSAPAWLPGNSGLVYQDPGSGGLYVTNLAGDTTQFIAYGQDPRGSRDGIWVYFGNQDATWRVHPDSTGLEMISNGHDYTPDPSPGDTLLVFIRTGFPPTEAQLVVRVLSSGAERPLGVQGWRPRWAPGGDRIAYWSGDLGSGAGAIYVIGADGTDVHQVSTPGRIYRTSGLDWSPDGQWIVAREDSTLDVIQVATGLTLPLGYGAGYYFASWRW